MNDYFVKHEACPSCGSRDNMARYASGSAYCFGCGHTEGRKRPVFTQIEKPLLALPDDVSTDFSYDMLEWVFKYEVTIEELLKHNVVCSLSWKQLIFCFYGQEKELVLWQARNFGKDKRKYFTQGDVAHVLPIYHSSNQSKTLVLVEDCISAIKLSRHVDAMPCLSSSISKDKLAKLKYLYDEIIVWLDGNMFNNALTMVQQCKFLGLESSAIYTELDPKEYNDNEIRQLIGRNK